MRKFSVTIFLSLCIFIAKAQDPHFSQFFASPLTLNPAFTGKFDGNWRLAVNHRDQWPSIPKAYVTTSASFDMPILRGRIPDGDVFGIGISGVSDQSANNALKLNYGSVSISYHKALDDDGFNTIGAAFQGTYSSLGLDMSKLTFEDMLRQNGFTGTTSDILTNGNTQNYFDINAGLLFSGSTDGYNNYYLGASMYHINRPRVSFKDQSWYLGGRLTLHGGGTIPINEMFNVNLSAIHQEQSKAAETVVGANIELNASGTEDGTTKLYIGSWMRLNDALIPYVGLEFNGLRIGASYDVNISKLKAATANRGGSEISIIYIKKDPRNKGIPCPKF